MAKDTTKVIAKILNILGLEINPATEETLQSIAGLSIPAHDYIAATYPTTSQEVYTYKTGGASGTVVGVITVNYQDSSKEVLLSVIKS